MSLVAHEYRYKKIAQRAPVSHTRVACPGRASGLVFRERHAPVAQLDRVPPSEGGGHRFESCRARHLSPNLEAAVCGWFPCEPSRAPLPRRLSPFDVPSGTTGRMQRQVTRFDLVDGSNKPRNGIGVRDRLASMTAVVWGSLVRGVTAHRCLAKPQVSALFAQNHQNQAARIQPVERWA